MLCGRHNEVEDIMCSWQWTQHNIETRSFYWTRWKNNPLQKLRYWKWPSGEDAGPRRACVVVTRTCLTPLTCDALLILGGLDKYDCSLTSRGKAKLRSHLALFIHITNWQKNNCDILLFFLSLETQKPWNLSFWYVSFQAYTELTWFRKFQDAENIIVTIFELSDVDIARMHTTMHKLETLVFGMLAAERTRNYHDSVNSRMLKTLMLQFLSSAVPILQENTPLWAWKLSFRHVNLQAYTELVWFRKF